MKRLKSIVESARFETAIMVIILINAVTLGLETNPEIMRRHGGLLLAIDQIVLGIFVLELSARLLIYRLDFWRDPWRIFDLIIVTIALLPTSGNLSVLRALRILRALRLISAVPSLRRVVGGLVAALPGMGSITLLLGLMFYVFSVMATGFYAQTFPQWFGSIGESAYSLFQIMTLESWSMGIVRPVMEQFPYAWLFFIVFILCTSFTVLNLFIGIIVSAMQREHEDEASAERDALHHEQQAILNELRSLREEIGQLRQNNSFKTE
jgi:voltage-gated sodium channel